jgi:hypothetical protein
MRLHIARVAAAFWLLVLSLTSLTLAQTAAQTASAPAARGTSSSATPSADAITPAVSGAGTTDFLPRWTNGSGALGNSILFQSGTGATAKIGINTSTPSATLEVKGTATVRGVFTLPAKAAATSAKGVSSQPLSLVASSFNSTSDTPINAYFNWQAEPAGNNSNSPSSTLNLLFGSAGSTPSETGLSISSTGLITFAPGQTFAGGGGAFCIATAGGFGSGGTTFVAPTFAVPAQNSCAQWSGFTKTASTVILSTSGSACLSGTGKTLTVGVSSIDPDFLGAGAAASDYIQLIRTSSTGSFNDGTDQGEFAGSAAQITCTPSVLSLPDIHN